MMHDPSAAIPEWAEFCTTIVVPLEIADASLAIDRIAALSVHPGIAVSLRTPLNAVPADLPVLLMAITPGRAGSPFDAKVLERVAILRERGRNPQIGVDGGVGTAQFAARAAAGANWVISGTSLFAAPDPGVWLRDGARAFGS